MTNEEKIQDTLDLCRRIANKNRLIESLIEWELDSLGADELTEFFFNARVEQYKNNPKDLEDMLAYRKRYEDWVK
jgi:hypothetical protein